MAKKFDHEGTSPRAAVGRGQDSLKRRWESQDFKKWALARESADEWKEWSNEELRTAMDLAVKNPGMALRGSTQGAVLTALFEEYLKRDFDGALVWFGGLVSDVVRQNLAHAITSNWPAERAEEGLDFVIANRDWFESAGGTASGRIIHGAVELAAMRGADDMDDLFGKLRENRLDPQYSDGWKFPENFDFRRLMAGPETQLLAEKGNLFFAGIWMGRDREQAFDSLVADGLADDRKLPRLFSDVLPTNGEARIDEARERARWLSEKFNELPEKRQEAGVQVIRDLVRSPAAMADFTQGLTDESDRRALSAEAIKRMVDKGPKPMLAFLQEIEDGSLGVGLFVEIDVITNTYSGRRWSLDDESESLLRKRFTEWKIPEAQANEIVGKLRFIPR